MTPWALTDPSEYLSQDLRAYAILYDIPLHDVWRLDLPGCGDGRTVADIHSLVLASRPSGLVRLLFAGRGRLFIDCRRRFSLSQLDVAGSTGVKSLLQPFAGRSPVVSGTSLVGTRSAMVLSAAEGATQIDPAGAARMRQKAEPAISAEGHATLQSRMGS